MFSIDPVDIPALEFVLRIMGVSFHAIQDRLVEVFSTLYLLFVLSILALEGFFRPNLPRKYSALAFFRILSGC